MAIMKHMSAQSVGMGGFVVEAYDETLSGGEVVIKTQMRSPKCALIGAYHTTPTATTKEAFAYTLGDQTVNVFAQSGAGSTTVRVIVFGYGA